MLRFLHRRTQNTDPVPESIYDFRVPAINGCEIDFSEFRGRKVMIVNTASFCGFTPQYEQLEELYKQHQEKLVIVGMPANNFFFQEPGSNKRIEELCRKKYHVSFPMGAKVSVKGRNMATLYTWLTQKTYNGHSDNEVKWNFQKYLIDENGLLTDIFYSKTTPLSEEVLTAVNR